MTFHPAYSEVEQHLNSQTIIILNKNLMLCNAASDITLILSNHLLKNIDCIHAVISILQNGR